MKRHCICGKEYDWPRQEWIHKECVVVNAATNVVVNKRSKDRHKKSEARREYMRRKMLDRRAAGIA